MDQLVGPRYGHATQELSPHDAGEVVDAGVAPRHQHLKAKMPGAGHSFTDIAVTDGLLLRPGSLRRIVAVDRDAMTVTALAGTPLAELNTSLARLDLSLHNMGDIDQQTVAGAISTGTYGRGGVVSSLSAQVAGLELLPWLARPRVPRSRGASSQRIGLSWGSRTYSGSTRSVTEVMISSALPDRAEGAGASCTRTAWDLAPV
jgi:FAD/FMN-containing dehydrogenase